MEQVKKKNYLKQREPSNWTTHSRKKERLSKRVRRGNTYFECSFIVVLFTLLLSITVLFLLLEPFQSRLNHRIIDLLTSIPRKMTYQSMLRLYRRQYDYDFGISECYGFGCINILYLHYQIVDTFLASQAQLRDLESQATVEFFKMVPMISCNKFLEQMDMGEYEKWDSQPHTFKNICSRSLCPTKRAKLIEIAKRSEKN